MIKITPPPEPTGIPSVTEKKFDAYLMDQLKRVNPSGYNGFTPPKVTKDKEGVIAMDQSIDTPVVEAAIRKAMDEMFKRSVTLKHVK